MEEIRTIVNSSVHLLVNGRIAPTWNCTQPHLLWATICEWKILKPEEYTIFFPLIYKEGWKLQIWDLRERRYESEPSSIIHKIFIYWIHSICQIVCVCESMPTEKPTQFIRLLKLEIIYSVTWDFRTELYCRAWQWF